MMPQAFTIINSTKPLSEPMQTYGYQTPMNIPKWILRTTSDFVTKLHFKMSYAKYQPCCSCLKVNKLPVETSFIAKSDIPINNFFFQISIIQKDSNYRVWTMSNGCLILKQLEMHGGIPCTVAVDDLVLKHQANDNHSAVLLYIAFDQFLRRRIQL